MKKNAGFTMIELMITVAIVGILLTVAVPSLKTFVQGNQLIASTNELVSSFHIARSEAIKLNASVSICTSANGTSCSGATNWATGWIVFVDTGVAGGDGATAGNLAGCTAATIGGECLLRVQDGVNDPQILVNGFFDTNNAAITALTFTGRGVPMDNNGASQSGTFSLCRLDGVITVDSRAVILGLPGRARVSDNVVVTCP